MIITAKGIIIRMAISQLRIMGRATQGVKLINLKDDDTIASIARVPKEEDSEIGIVKDTEETSPEKESEFEENDSLNSSEQKTDENQEDDNDEETSEKE